MGTHNVLWLEERKWLSSSEDTTKLDTLESCPLPLSSTLMLAVSSTELPNIVTIMFWRIAF